MLIRYGYEIAVNCPQRAPMVCLLSVSEDRKADIRIAEKVFTTPIIPTTTYLDTFGNRCRRLVAPVGDFAIWGDATIEDDGKIDPANFAAREVPVADLPDYCLLFLMVCRDFAHLAVTLCRCLNIPARYVNGHLGDIGVPVVDPMDFSAWIEVFLEGSWWTFDPRNNIPRIGRIVVARGRDAADIPLINSFGPHILKSFRVWTYEVTEQPATTSDV